MQPIRTALIGFGKAGEWLHAPFIDILPEFKLDYILERSGERAKEIYPNVNCVRDIDSVLNDSAIELIVIATPNATHAAIAELALKHGKHVLVDKPFTITAQEARHIQTISEENDKQVFVYQNRRWDGDFLTVQKLIDSGVLGEISYIESRFDRNRPEPRTQYWKESDAPGNGLWYDIGPHLMDQAFTLFGTPLKTKADIKIQRPGAIGIDYFDVLFQYASMEYRIHASMLEKDTPRWLVKGSKGTFCKYGTDPQEALLSKGIKPVGVDWGKEEADSYGIITSVDSKTIAVTTEQGDYRVFYGNVYESIRNYNPFPVRIESAVKLVEWLEKKAIMN